jgi:hypothetical protein
MAKISRDMKDKKQMYKNKQQSQSKLRLEKKNQCIKRF